MDRSYFIDEIKFRLTGDVLETEINEAGFYKIIEMSLRELQRYIRDTKLITVPYENCIDLSNLTDESGAPIKVAGIDNVYRASGLYTTNDGYNSDPVAMQYATLYGTGSMRNFQSQLYNFMSYSTLGQIQNTLSTDLAFKFDPYANKLYINVSSGVPSHITIEYIQKFERVEDIESNYWIDILIQLATANAKVILGRIRSRYTQTNALWTQDGESILEEGKTELAELRQHLKDNCWLTYPID